MHTRHIFAGILATTILLAAAPGGAAMLMAGEPGATLGEPQQTERFSRTVPLAKGGSVVISNVAGDIVVTGGQGDQVVIDAVKHGRSADDLKNVSIEVIAADGRVEIATRHQRGSGFWGNNAAVNYTIKVPRSAMVRVKSVSGDVQLSSVDGEVRAESVSGTVRVSDAAQVEGVVSVSGDVLLKSAASNGAVSVSSVSGNVRINLLKAPTVTGSSVSGDVELTDVSADRLSVKSVSGGLVFTGPLAKAGRYALKSHSGDVIVRLLNAAGFEVTATSFSGDIHSDVPLTVRFGGPGNERRHGRSQEVRGSFGDGSATLELQTFSGDVRIEGTSKPAQPVKK